VAREHKEKGGKEVSWTPIDSLEAAQSPCHTFYISPIAQEAIEGKLKAHEITAYSFNPSPTGDLAKLPIQPRNLGSFPSLKTSQVTKMPLQSQTKRNTRSDPCISSILEAQRRKVTGEREFELTVLRVDSRREVGEREFE